jgi:phytoene dehydrogenase-like protein
LGSLGRGDGGFPEGGSLPFVERIVTKFTFLGGQILYGKRASRIVMENGAVKGVLVGNELLDAEAVIVTADTMSIDYLFENPPQTEWLAEMHSRTEPTMNTFVSIGVNADLRTYPKTGVFKLNKPISISSRTYEYFYINNYAADNTYSPQGKSALTISLEGDTYDFWKKARDNGTYAQEKQKLTDDVIKRLAEIMPETKDRIEICDIATPLTYERYLGNWKGSWMTEMTPHMKLNGYPSVIDGLAGVYFAGQRLMPPGGLPVALMTGRIAVQHLCRDTDTLFISED